MIVNKNWHNEKIDDVYRYLESDGNGISSTEAEKRFTEYGPNELMEKARKTPLRIFFDQFGDFMIMILLGAAVIAGILGELTDTIVIVAIVILNAVIGFIQEYRAEKAMDALKAMAAPQASVIRDGVLSKVKSREVVPGDIVALEAGVIIPADMRIVEAAVLRVDEAALTGESVPVEKIDGVMDNADLSLADRLNMAYKGTIVTYGRGLGIVTSTGMNTELGKIAAMLQDEEEVKTPLQRRLAVFGKKLAIAVLIICAVVFAMGMLRGEAPLLMLLTAISLAVAAIPEALPAVITISLAIGARKLVKENALVRKLPAVETLGSVTYICSDKTGTLTLNQMTAEEVFTEGKAFSREDNELKKKEHLLQALALSNDAERDVSGNMIGDPTEIALFAIAEDHGFKKDLLRKGMPRVAEIPFDSERKCMTTFHKKPSGGFVSFTKGADALLEAAETQMYSDGAGPLDKKGLLQANDEMARRGLRVIWVAMREWDEMPETISPETVEKGLTILGLAGLMDPPREEAKEAVALCKGAGMQPVMITGDHPITAHAIARRIGLLDDGAEERIMTGREIEQLSMDEFEKKVSEVRVYARVAPEQKLKIVKALQDKGQLVAMTGDGVNDAPALKRADIGVAMGITGTDVSKEASHMILLDDNFATIVKAIKEGRKIYDNIRKFIRYLLTTNSGEIWTLFLAPFLGLPVPLLPIHILWVNLVTDSLPALALSLEPAEEDVMRRPPRNPGESIFARGLGIQALWVGLFMGILVLSVQALSLAAHDSHWQTMVFTVLCLTQLGNSLAVRSEYNSLFHLGLLSNKALLGAVLICFGLQMLTIYVPFFNVIFKTQPLSLAELAICVGASSLVFFAVEIQKWIVRRRRK